MTDSSIHPSSTYLPLWALIIALLMQLPAQAQMKRERAVKDGPVQDTFLAGSVAGLSTVETLPKGNLNTMTMHNFGLLSGGLETFYGLDGGAVVRLGIDYGLTDRMDIGIGRTSEENTVDIRLKYALLRQSISGKTPVSIAFKGDVGINTQKERRFDFSFNERLNYLASLMVARKFSDRLSLQLAPMISHFNTVVIEQEQDDRQHTIAAIGVAGRYKFSKRNALTFEYLPVLTEKNSQTKNHAAIGYEIDTGGHVFQLFIMSGRWFTEQHLIARTDADASALDFRFGFNINRVFSL